jgi:hypothetical protein
MMLSAMAHFAKADDQSDASQQPAGVPETDPVPPVPTSPTEATPVRQVDSNPQDGEVYRVPVGVEDKTPNLTAAEPFVHGSVPPPTPESQAAAAAKAEAEQAEALA